MTELGSAPLPEPGPRDHVRGEGEIFLVYADFECPFCAQLHERMSALAVREVFRHFPVRSSHPRAWPAACAAEAAGLQGRFWEMHDRLMADPARLEDPHLWQRAAAIGLDLDRFETDRRGDQVQARVREDFRDAIRAGVMGTPTLFAAGERHTGRIDEATLRRLAHGDR